MMETLRKSSIAVAALLLSLAAIVFGGVEFYYRQQGLAMVKAESARRQAELGSEISKAKARIATAEADLKQSQVRVAELEARIAEREGDRAAIAEMVREVARNSDDRLLAEAEQMLGLAQQQLTLAGDVQGAVIALQAADQRLARGEKQMLPLRRILAKDLERLRALPMVDTAGTALRLDALITSAQTVPIAVATPATEFMGPPPQPPAAESGVVRALQAMWADLSQLVRIRELEPSEVTLLAPKDEWFARENIKLRLLTARLALFSRDEANYRADLKAADAVLERYFDKRALATRAMREAVKQLAASPVSIALPDINASLAAVREARIQRERPLK